MGSISCIWVSTWLLYYVRTIGWECGPPFCRMENLPQHELQEAVARAHRNCDALEEEGRAAEAGMRRAIIGQLFQSQVVVQLENVEVCQERNCFFASLDTHEIVRHYAECHKKMVFCFMCGTTLFKDTEHHAHLVQHAKQQQPIVHLVDCRK